MNAPLNNSKTPVALRSLRRRNGGSQQANHRFVLANEGNHAPELIGKEEKAAGQIAGGGDPTRAERSHDFGWPVSPRALTVRGLERERLHDETADFGPLGAQG